MYLRLYSNCELNYFCEARRRSVWVMTTRLPIPLRRAEKLLKTCPRCSKWRNRQLGMAIVMIVTCLVALGVIAVDATVVESAGFWQIFIGAALLAATVTITTLQFRDRRDRDLLDDSECLSYYIGEFEDALPQQLKKAAVVYGIEHTGAAHLHGLRTLSRLGGSIPRLADNYVAECEKIRRRFAAALSEMPPLTDEPRLCDRYLELHRRRDQLLLATASNSAGEIAQAIKQQEAKKHSSPSNANQKRTERAIAMLDACEQALDELEGGGQIMSRAHSD